MAYSLAHLELKKEKNQDRPDEFRFETVYKKTLTNSLQSSINDTPWNHLLITSQNHTD